MSHTSSSVLIAWPLAGALALFSAESAEGAVTYSGLQNIAIPANFEGVDLDVNGDSTWDLNFFFGGLGVANNDSLRPAAMGAGSSSNIRLFSLGSEVKNTSLFTDGYGVSGAEDNSGHLGPGTSQFGDGAAGYLGFKLERPSDTPVYGWMQVVLTRNGSGGLIKDWAIDDSGAPIISGFVGFAPGASVTTVSTGTVAVSSGELLGTNLQLGSDAEITFTEEATFSGVLVGSGTLNLTGGGDLHLTGANPFSGTIAIGDGSNLTIDSSENLGSASVVLSDGAALVFAATSDNDNGLNTFRNDITVGATGNTVLENNGTGEVNLSGALGGGDASSVITKTGTGVMTLSGDTPNTFQGTIEITGGELQLAKTGGANAIEGDLTISGGTLNVAGSDQIADDAQLTLGRGGAMIFTGTGLTETIGTLTNDGGIFSTGANSLTGSGNSIYWSGASTNTVSDGGLLGDAHFAISGGTNTVEGGASGGVLQVLTGSLGLQLSNGATLTLNSDNAVPGKLLLQGTVSVTGDATATIASGLSLTNKGTIDLGGGTRTFAVGDGTAATDLLISATLVNGGLIKAGDGTMQLTALNPYSGSTTINGGTLELQGASASLSATSSLSIDGGTLLLAGTEGSAVNNAAPITLGGSSAAASALQLSGAVTETLGNLTLSGSSGLRVIDFGSGSGILTFNVLDGTTSGLALQVWNWNGNAYRGGGTDRLILAGGLGSNLTLSDITFFSDSGFTSLGTPTWVSGTSGELVVAVPEAGTLGALLALLGPLAWRERRQWARCPEARSLPTT